MIVHLDEVEQVQVAEADIAFVRRRLGAAAGCRRIGASHFVVPPGARQMPVHVHGEEEEIFYVLAGGGLSYEGTPARPRAYPVTAGDAIVQPPNGKPHTFLAGDEGLELLAFASGAETHTSYLPRAGAMFVGARWVPIDGPHPLRAEALVGPLERPEVDPDLPRPSNIVALADAELEFDCLRALGRTAGAVKAGLNHLTLTPGPSGVPHHCHSLEEELYIVLDGSGSVRLGDDEHPIAAGHVIARPPGTGVSHSISAGPDGLTYLVYGTREPGDSVYYPEFGTVRLRGLGVTIAVDQPQR